MADRRAGKPGRRERDVLKGLAWTGLAIALVVSISASLALGLGYSGALDKADEALARSAVAVQTAASAHRHANHALQVCIAIKHHHHHSRR